jgi:EAL domain-containing protein (putative c-di-GMP-specific phosphodiesterase class I)
LSVASASREYTLRARISQVLHRIARGCTLDDMSIALHPRDLRAAFHDGGLQIAFQPQWNLQEAWNGEFRTSRPVAVEALSRWHHASTGEVPPTEFIPLAERGLFLHELDIDVLDRAARQVAAWQSTGHAIGLAVNAAPSHFSSSYVDAALEIADKCGLDLASLTVEITETPSPQFSESMRSALESLRAAAISVSVDDFGASDTTVDMLRGLPISEVKLDRSLVLRTDWEADDLIAEVVTASDDEGWRVVAEGIETTEDLKRSVARGCHRGQGFLWGRPAAAPMIEALLG